MRFKTPWNNLIRLSIGFTHFKEKKFGHYFEDCIEPICSSGNYPKTTNQFFLHCTNFDVQSQTHLSKITSIDDAILEKNKNHTDYVVISKTKAKISLIKCTFINEHSSFNREI